MSFLNEISIYNAAADFRISTASTKQASLWTGLKNTANDLTLSNDTRLRALTALITSAELLEVAISFSYPSTTSPVNPIASGTVIHNDTVGLQGGTSTERYHSTFAQQTAWDNKASLSDITFANILGAVASNGALVAAFSAKQNLLSGNGLVRLAGSTLTYDNSVYLTNITGISSGGELQGTYPNPTLLNSAVIGKVLTGFSATNSAIVATDSIVAMASKAQGQIDALSALAANSITDLTGDVSAAGPGSAAATISNNAVTFAKFQQIAQGFMGRSSVGTGTGALLTPTQATALLNTFSSSLKGLVPASIVADGTKVLYDDGTWAVPPASGSGSVTNVSGAGIASLFSLSITNPSTTPALAFALINQSANRIFAGPTTGAAAAPTWRLLAVSDIPELPISQIAGLQGELDGYLPDALANGMLFIGNVSDVAVNAIVTGDLTATYVDNSGTNEAEFTIANEAVTYAKIQNVTSQTLLGRFALTDGVAQQLTLNGSDFTINSSTGVIGLVTPNSPILTTKGDILTHTGAAQARLGIGANATFFMADTAATTGNKWVAMSGDATIATSGALTIAAGAVTLAKMANMATNSFIGRISASTGVPEILTATQATSLLNLFSSSAKGLAPVVTGAAIGDATYFLNATGTWTVPAGGGGGSGTVTSVSVVSANGFAGTVATATTTPAITLTTSITGLLKGNGTAISAATAGTDYLTSVGLTMPSAFTVTTSPLTANGTLAVTGAGTVSQYVRGDGTLANFPTSGGGGASLSYYLNGSVASSVAGYEQMNRVPVIGAGTNYTLNNTTGYQLMAQFVTDANDPSLLNIPAGAWDIGFYFSSSNNTGNPAFYVELLKYDGTTFTTIANNSANPEIISNGTAVDLYNTSIAVSSTSLTITDRLVIRVYVDTAGSRTITFHTEDNNLAQIITTFTTGLTAFNGLTAQVQFLGAVGTTGTAPAWTSTTATHTLNIPLASAASVTAGLISKTEYDTFNGKLANVLTTTGDIIYSSSGTTAARLGIGTTGQVLSVVGGIPAWSSAGSGDVTGPASSVDGNFAVFDSTTGKIIKESAGASLSAAGVAVFNTSLALGVSSTTTGQLIFRNSANAFTTTIQASTSASANASYTWPQAQGTAGQILSTDVSGNLSWIAAGTGDMTLAGVQTVTGAKTFGAAGNVGKLILAGSTSGTTVLNAGATGTNTLTLPIATSTLACLGLAQTFTTAQTFTGGVTVSTSALSVSSAATFSNTVTTSGVGSQTTPAVAIANSTIAWMSFTTAPEAVPALSAVASRSTGTRIVLRNTLSITNPDYAIGCGSNSNWYSAPQRHEFYTLNTTLNNVGTFGTQGLTLGYAGSQTNANLLINSSTIQWMSFSLGTTNFPTITGARSTGTKIVLSDLFSAGSRTDHAIGVGANTQWYSIPDNLYQFQWYERATNIMTLSGGGALTLVSDIIGAATQNVFNTVSTTVNFAGAATTLNIGTTTSAITALNIGTGAGSSAKTINIGTGSTGSTTTINIGSAGGATNTIAIRGNLTLGTSGGNMGFWGTAAVARQTITSDTLANLYTALRAYGLIL